jgi:gamma-glutamylcyclotransferase (GGCT)/AIG2-like uncharacterized protein YtfP
MTKVFCYGTLKQGFHAHRLISSPSTKFLGEAATHPRFHLYNVSSFPGMVEGDEPDGGVRGELYEVDDGTLAVLDRYECVSQGLFTRSEVELDDGSVALAYLFSGDEHMGMTRGRRIEAGEWTQADN